MVEAIQTRKPAKGSKGKAAAVVVSRPKKKAYPYEYCDAIKREKAKVTTHKQVTDDPICQFLLANSETKFPQKMVYGPNDWLVTQKEAGQDLKRYTQGGPDINWHNPKANSKILLFIIDDTINDELANLYLMYCKAFYYGLKVELIKPGSKIKEAQRNGKTIVKHKLPNNFLETHNI